MIAVVAAVIEEADRFLVTRRQPGVHLEGFWEFPGGKLASGEPPADGLRREIREELDAEVEVLDLVLSTSHTYPDRTVALHFYRCRLLGEPRPLLGQEMRWVPRGALASLAFPPADEALIAILTGVGRRRS